MLDLLIQIVGTCVLLRLVYDLVIGVYNFFLRPGKNLKQQFGSWAVVTGATDGIGKAFAFELASKGLNVVLMSRTKSKLDDTAKEISDKHGVEVKVLAVDYSDVSNSNAADVRPGWAQSVEKTCKDLPIGVLINNVGTSYEHPEFFHEIDDGKVAGLVNLNVVSTVWMTRIVLAGMVERQAGAIVNIGSIAGRRVNPLLAGYSAAKGFVERFSDSLHAEYSKKGIVVQCQAPAFVTTKLSKIRKSSLDKPTPKVYVKSAVKAIGYEPTISPYWVHQTMIYVSNLLPDSVWTNYVMNLHLSIRKRARKKLAKGS